MVIYETLIKKLESFIQRVRARHTTQVFKEQVIGYVTGAFCNVADFKAHCKCNSKVSVFQNKENGWINL